MQMTPGASPSPLQIDRLVEALAPIVTEANQVFDAGAAMQSVLREAVLAGFLAGRGMAPAQAMQTVMQWQTSGLARSLARQGRAAGGGRPIGEPGGAGAGAQAQTGAGGQPGTQAGGQVPLAGRELTAAQRTELVPQLEKFIQDQATAAAFYQDLMDQTKPEEIKDYIRHAMEDEQKHYRMLQGLYRDLTGRTYTAEPAKVEYPTLAAGLKKAMDDEYEASEEYRDTYLKYDDRRIRNLFFELLNDELEHATRFNYALQVVTGETT